MNLPAKKPTDSERLKEEWQEKGKLVFRYFFQGIFILAPLVLTFYILFALVSFLIAFLDELIPLDEYFDFPGRDIIVIVVIITVTGYLSQTLILKPFFEHLERVMTRVPLAKIIYTAIRDLFSAFVSEKRKFEQPVLVVLNENPSIKKMGFITQEDAGQLNASTDVAVYFPHSYNFSGNLYIVPIDSIIVLDISATEAMKFIVSGGVTPLRRRESPKIKEEKPPPKAEPKVAEIDETNIEKEKDVDKPSELDNKEEENKS